LRQGLERLAIDEPSRFRLCLVLSSPTPGSSSWSGAVKTDACLTLPSTAIGCISDNLIACALGHVDDAFQDVLVLCCGPEGFNEAVVGSLNRISFPAQRLHVF